MKCDEDFMTIRISLFLPITRPNSSICAVFAVCSAPLLFVLCVLCFERGRVIFVRRYLSDVDRGGPAALITRHPSIHKSCH
jgi:hypothetical protein